MKLMIFFIILIILFWLISLISIKYIEKFVVTNGNVNVKIEENISTNNISILPNIDINNNTIKTTDLKISNNISSDQIITDNLNSSKDITSSGNFRTNRININKICDKTGNKCFNSFADILSKYSTNGSTNNLTIIHPNGIAWKYDKERDVVTLNTGYTLFMSVYDNIDIFNNSKGRIGLKNIQDGNFIRHSGFILHSNSLISNNYDFAWNFVSNNDGTFKIYNDYGGGYYIGYDSNLDVVLIVSSNDNRIVNWKTNPNIITLSSKLYDNTNYNDSDLGKIQVSNLEECINICANNDNCNGAVFDNITNQNTCYLKNSMNNQIKQDGVKSWIKKQTKPKSLFDTYSQNYINIKSSGRDNLCLDIAGASSDDRAAAIGWSCHGGGNQQWRYDEQQRLIVKHTGKCLDVEGGNTENGGKVIQWPCHSGDNQKWIYDSYNRLVPKHAKNKCLSLQSQTTNDGTQFVINDCLFDNKTQKFF